MRFLDAATRIGVPKELIDASRQAFEGLQDLVRTHAGDRASADILLGPLTDEGRRRLELSLRRDGFRAHAHVLGVQASALYQADVILPPKPGFLPDVARVRGHFGLRRNRADVRWIVARSTVMHADGPRGDVRREPLQSGDATDGSAPALLHQFCSDPLPVVERRVIGGVTVEDVLQPGMVGQIGAVDVVTGERFGQMPRRDFKEDAVVMPVSVPCERLCYEVLMPRALLERKPRLRVHSTIQTEMPYVRGPDFAAIPVPETLENLGDAQSAPSAPYIPRHAQMLRWMLDQIGPVPGGLELWRVRMRFPPIPICIAVSYSLTG